MQGRKVFARTSEGELNRTAGSQVSRVDTVPALPDTGDDRRHQALIVHAVVFTGYPFDQRQIGFVKLIDSLFEGTASEVGNNLKLGRYVADFQDAQASDEVANFAFRDDILLRILPLWRFAVFSRAFSFCHNLPVILTFQCKRPRPAKEVSEP